MKPIPILLIGLVLILTALELCSKQIIPSTGIIQIVTEKKTYNIADHIFQRQMTQKVKAKRGSVWHGVYLAKFFTENGFDVKKYQQCTLVAKDGMRITIPMDEITDNQAFITFVKDKKSGKYDLKLIMLQDSFEQRWLKYIVQIILE